MKKALNLGAIILGSVLANFTYSQTGPGGIGNSTTNVLWVKVDDITGLNDGDDITTWADASGNNNDLSQPTTSFQPVYVTNVVNGLPVVRFNKTNGRLRRNPFNSFPSTEITSVLVNINNGESSDGVLSYASTAHNNNYLLFSSNNLRLYRNSHRTMGVDLNNNVWNIASVSWRQSSGVVEAWKNGDVDHYSTGFASGSSITANGSLALAGEQDGVDASYASNQAHFGDFTEVIVFNFFLDTADQIIISNYLSAKYDIALDANDLYDEDDAVNGNFDFEVAGIGRRSSTALNDDAQGSGMVRMLNPTDLDNNEYLIWGHNNLLAQASNNTDVPAGVQGRFERVWRVSEVSNASAGVDVGSVDMRWDLSDFAAITSSHLRLLVDTDNDGFFNDETPIAGATDLGGGIYEFAGVSALSNNVRFTIATTNITLTPLPIELTTFNVSRTDEGTVNLNWITATEINNDFFTLERSTDYQQWEKLTEVKGAGQSNNQQYYKWVDISAPGGTVYYRLSQTDFDGTVSKPVIRTIEPVNGLADLKLYPNPAQNRVRIEAQSLNPDELKLFSASGQEIEIQGLIELTSGNSITLNISGLPKGVYYVNTQYKTKKLVIADE